ncbi:MAG: 50S ribosomal protein L21e [Candidatus Bathyarchaeota archaeon]|nr:MAG: 50S ribosomal protein L21e [Candidatus Bathyarchaeota archaeon]
MGRKSKGYRKRTRSLLRRKPRERGKTGLSKILHEYKPGEKVVIKVNPSVLKGMPHRRYHGRTGVIADKRGRAYVVEVPQGDAIKEIIARPEHLKPMTGG